MTRSARRDLLRRQRWWPDEMWQCDPAMPDILMLGIDGKLGRG